MPGKPPRPVVVPPWVFYGSPYAPKGLWLRADICTAQVACGWCSSPVWVPCRGKHMGYVAGSCGARRSAAAKLEPLEVPGLTIHLRDPRDTRSPGVVVQLAPLPEAEEGRS